MSERRPRSKSSPTMIRTGSLLATAYWRSSLLEDGYTVTTTPPVRFPVPVPASVARVLTGPPSRDGPNRARIQTLPSGVEVNAIC